MRRLSVTLPAALVLALPVVGQEPAPVPWANKFFTGKTETPPPVILQDFGTLPKGTVRTYRFRMTNIYAFPMQVREPQASCGCVSVVEYTGTMNPRDTGRIDIRVDTSRVEGPKVVKLPVRFDGFDPTTGRRFFSTADLEIRVVSRPDVAFTPGSVAFGVVPFGRKATQTVNVVYSGRQPNWAVSEATYNKDLMDVDVAPVRAVGARAAFQVTATLKPTAPPGVLNETIVLKTNDVAGPALTLAVTGTVQAPLTLFGPDKDGLFRMGKVEIGKKFERNVVVQADKKIKAIQVEGQGDGVTAFVPPLDANKSRTLTIAFAPEKPGPVKKVLTIKTDAGDSVSLTVEGLGVEP